MRKTKTLSVKLEKRNYDWVAGQAAALNRSMGKVIRDLIQEKASKSQRNSIGTVLSDLCGCLDGPKDLSTRKLDGYGR
jgi:hypothetical protein